VIPTLEELADADALLAAVELAPGNAAQVSEMAERASAG